MAGNVNSNLNALLKVLYPSGDVGSAVYNDFPFLAMLKKNTKFDGHYAHIPYKVYNGSNASGLASVAFANSNVSKNVAFAVTRGKDYSLAQIPREDWLASKGKGSAAFVDTAKYEVDGEIQEVTRRISQQLFRTGSGNIGLVGSLSTTTLTLATASDARYFEIGMEIAGSATDGSGSLRDSGSTCTVTAVDRSAGTVTTDSDWDSQISGLVAGDYLFAEGDYDSAATGTIHLKGLGAWVTTGTPGALYGVTRTTDAVRLSGIKSTISGSLREGFIDMAKDMYVQTNARPDILLLNPTKWADLAKELESDRQFSETMKFGDYSFEGISLRTPNGMVKVIGDADCPEARGYMLTLKDWELSSLGGCPHIVDEDGSYLDRTSDADSFAVRVAAYTALICRNPGHQGVASIS